MSIRVMGYVWDGFPGAGSELLAMLALADWCDDNGTSLFPSMAAVGQKIRVGEKQARRIMHGFEEDGYLQVIGNANGGKPGTTRQYKLNVAKLKALALGIPDTPPAKGSPPTGGSPTPPAQGSPTPPAEGSRTPPTGDHDPSLPGEVTPPTQGSLTTNEPPIEPPVKTEKPKKPKAPAAPTPAFLVPDWINASHWAVYWQHASRKKATPEQMQLVVEKLAKWRDKGIDYALALENSATNGWQGLFEPDAKPHGGNRPAKGGGRYDAAARTIFGNDDQHPGETDA